MRPTRLCASALLTIVAAVLLGAAPSDPPAHVPDAKNGKTLFTAKGCVACHQADGHGGIKLTGNPTPDWRDAKRMADSTHDDAYLRDCITNGKPKSGMISWRKQLKPEQIEDLIAHIRTFSKPGAAEEAKKK